MYDKIDIRHAFGRAGILFPAVLRVIYGNYYKFFRFPGFESTEATLDALQSRGIMVFGTDLWASDWNVITPKQELKLLIDRLKVARKGIILLHDPKAQTAAMMPAFLRYLRDNRYRVVHLVPATAATPAATTQNSK